ncbi:hypothetical protein E4U22_002321 [Claviceps purpurea]|nr:hypothetical protein E4U22_002321 [Claviceps purpurea]
MIMSHDSSRRLQRWPPMVGLVHDYTSLSFLNGERNDGMLHNIILKFIAPTLKKASGIMNKFPRGTGNMTTVYDHNSNASEIIGETSKTKRYLTPGPKVALYGLFLRVAFAIRDVFGVVYHVSGIIRQVEADDIVSLEAAIFGTVTTIMRASRDTISVYFSQEFVEDDIPTCD